MPKERRWAYRRKLAGKFESMKKATQSEIPNLSPDCNRIITVDSLLSEKKK